ncbi:MAG: M64 family metallopeptidase [Bacteroidales bacterium]|nr:M64 family metallopeptidase [Bacteroidales bacterium]
MKKIIFPFLLLVASFQSFATFDDWFINKTLRIDYYHTGNSKSELYSIDQVKSEPYWGGSHVTLIDTLNYGEYYFKIFDVRSNTLIYSHGYCALFDEWQFTEEAKHTSRTFTETAVMPFPKNDVRIEFFSRNFLGIYEKKFEYTIAVTDYFISPERQMVFPVYDALISGDPAQKVDIVILPEGYTPVEMDKFKADCDKFTAGLFTFEPYAKNRDKFNIRAVLAPSTESGTDIPGEKVWKNTIMNSSFYTFDSERYLMTYDNKSVRNLAANTPYDQIYILVNSSKYGGGAIYNYYSTSVNSNSSSAKIFVHEFGHGFAALADEYDDGSTSFNDMYPLNLEPWEPNITTLVKFETKWKDMLPANTPVPTPIENGSGMKLGVYEGGGYVAKGVYRPASDCLMRTFRGNEFCPVCNAAIQKMLDFYTK